MKSASIVELINVAANISCVERSVLPKASCSINSSFRPANRFLIVAALRLAEASKRFD